MRVDPAGLREDVDRIAAKFGLNRFVLAAAVRCAEVTETHRVAVENGAPEDAAPLLAARDRKDEPDQPRSPGSGG